MTHVPAWRVTARHAGDGAAILPATGRTLAIHGHTARIIEHSLENRQLIQRGRRGRSRKIRVTLLREDGSGLPYTRPGKGNADRFMKLPHSYWMEGWHDLLNLPATAMLLVALHEKTGFRLPTKYVPEWYGWSADTAERGFARLRELNLLDVTTRLVKAPLSPTGLAEVNEYTLRGPFTQPEDSGATEPDGNTSTTKTGTIPATVTPPTSRTDQHRRKTAR
jgi:hypothetical protein